MPIHHSIWKVEQRPQALKRGRLDSEATLDNMIVTAPEILSPEWMIIGRQEDTGHGGRIDLLVLAGWPVLIKLNRARTLIHAGQSIGARQFSGYFTELADRQNTKT